MSTIPPESTGHTGLAAWRVLVLDHDREDPKLILAVIASPADVRPAGPGEGGPDKVAVRWVTARLGEPVRLTPLRHPEVWLVDRARR